MRPHDDGEWNHEKDNAVCAQPVLGTTAKRPKLFSPTTTAPSSPPPILPDELIVEILVRLPVQPLLQFRNVCESWKTLISSPEFAKDHLQRSNADPTMTHQRLMSSIGDCKMVSCPVQSAFDNPSTPPKVDSIRMGRSYNILGSCNGLVCVCLYATCHGYVRLWNPSTGLRSKRTQIVAPSDGYVGYRGFGYDHVHDKYKLLVVFEKNFGKTVTKVYTFGENSWTTIQDFSCDLTGWLGKFVSGTLNWLVRVLGTSKRWVILSFDLAKETHRQVLLPGRDDDNHCIPVLGVLRNCLCVCIDHQKTHWLCG